MYLLADEMIEMGSSKSSLTYEDLTFVEISRLFLGELESYADGILLSRGESEYAKDRKWQALISSRGYQYPRRHLNLRLVSGTGKTLILKLGFPPTFGGFSASLLRAFLLLRGLLEHSKATEKQEVSMPYSKLCSLVEVIVVMVRWLFKNRSSFLRVLINEKSDETQPTWRKPDCYLAYCGSFYRTAFN